MKKAVITVVGKDAVGIMAKTCAYLADENINILDISQTVVQGYFNMMMIADMSAAKGDVEDHCEALAKLGLEIGVEIKLQAEEIFTQMHRI